MLQVRSAIEEPSSVHLGGAGSEYLSVCHELTFREISLEGPRESVPVSPHDSELGHGARKPSARIPKPDLADASSRNSRDEAVWMPGCTYGISDLGYFVDLGPSVQPATEGPELRKQTTPYSRLTIRRRVIARCSALLAIRPGTFAETPRSASCQEVQSR